MDEQKLIESCFYCEQTLQHDQAHLMGCGNYALTACDDCRTLVWGKTKDQILPLFHHEPRLVALYNQVEADALVIHDTGSDK